MRKYLLIIPAFLLIIVLLVVIFHKPSTKLIDGPFYRLARNIQQADLIDGQEYFFTGSSFAKLDISSGKTIPLSNYFNTGGTIVVNSWSTNSVIFNTAGVDATDIFGVAATRAGLNPTANHWWRYDFDSKQMALLDFKAAESCSSINEADNILYCFAQNQGNSHDYELYGYSLVDNTQRPIEHFSDTVNSPKVAGKNLYFLTTRLSGAQTLHKYSTDSNSSSEIYTSNGTINFSAASSQIFLDEYPLTNSVSGNKRSINTISSTPLANQKLILLDESNKKVASYSLPNTSPLGQFSSSTNSVDYTLPSGEFYSADGTKIKAYTINRANTVLVWLIDGKTYYLDNIDAFYSEKIGSSLKAADGFVETTNTYPNKFYVSQLVNGQNTVYLNDSSKSFNGNAQAVNAFLLHAGYDSNQFNFNWQPISIGSDTSDFINVSILK